LLLFRSGIRMAAWFVPRETLACRQAVVQMLRDPSIHTHTHIYTHSPFFLSIYLYK
jgi:hypothetical protein